MLLTSDWHPWFSYEWWQGIGVPALGAVGSIAVGAGAIVVALHSNRIAQLAALREEAAKLEAEETARRSARGDFGLVAAEWLNVLTDELVSDWAKNPALAPKGERRSGDYKQELDVRAATLGDRSAELVASINDRMRKINGSSERLRTIAVLNYRLSQQSIQSWVADAESWWFAELAARRQQKQMSDWADGFRD